MKHVFLPTLLALVLALAMVFALAACGRTESEGSGSGESGKSGGKTKTKETPAPEFVYAATYEPVSNKFENLNYFYPTMTTEDFGYFIDAAKGSFYHIGAGCSAPLHNSRFLPEPCTIIRLSALHADIIGHYLLQEVV